MAKLTNKLLQASFSTFLKMTFRYKQQAIYYFNNNNAFHLPDLVVFSAFYYDLTTLAHVYPVCKYLNLNVPNVSTFP